MGLNHEGPWAFVTPVKAIRVGVSLKKIIWLSWQIWFHVLAAYLGKKPATWPYAG